VLIDDKRLIIDKTRLNVDHNRCIIDNDMLVHCSPQRTGETFVDSRKTSRGPIYSIMNVVSVSSIRRSGKLATTSKDLYFN
ncbi:hypothetical protein Pmar_PMAR010126, partial [Perkinsus marinus ATCC 50983]